MWSFVETEVSSKEQQEAVATVQEVTVMVEQVLLLITIK